MKRIISLLTILLTSLLLTSCINEKSNYERKVIYLKPVFSIVPYVDLRVDNKFLTSETITKLEKELNQIVVSLDQKFNIQYRNDGIKTELMRVNENAGIEPVKVSQDVIIVLKAALEATELSICKSCTEALFDPTIAPLWDTWGFLNNYFDPLDGNYIDPPTSSEIEAALELVDYQKISIDEDEQTVFLEEKGMKLDLGGIVKGYAADKVKEYLLAQGIKKAIIDMGGNIHTIGMGYTKEGTDRPWRLGLHNPTFDILTNEPKTFGTYEIEDLSIVTSGTYERYIKDTEGTEYHHILDPRTGYPFNNNVVSTTIITANSMRADALSTTVLALGLAEGMKLIESLPGVEAVFVIKNGDSFEVYISSGAEQSFSYNEAMNEFQYTFKGVYKGV